MSQRVSQHPKIFISYSWDSDKHKEDVFLLSNRLRQDGIDCHIDQYEVFPQEGWLNWMRNQVEEADFVLLICTKQYKQRFQGKEELGKGNGVTWEGAIISQLIYDQVRNNKFIPVILSPIAKQHIPTELLRYTYFLLRNFSLDRDKGYEALYRHITHQPDTTKPILGKIVSLPPRDRQQYDSQPEQTDVFNQLQQQKLNELYQDATKQFKRKQWQKVILTFQQMEEQNLPFSDPKGIYRESYNKLLEQQEWLTRQKQKQNKEKRYLENLYIHGNEAYKTRDWQIAQKRFEELLQRKPKDIVLQTQVQEKLAQVEKKLEQDKWISLGLIATGWVVSGIIDNISSGIIGGISSGFAIWRVSSKTKTSIPWKQVFYPFLFVFIGILVGVIIWKVFSEYISSADYEHWIKAFMGMAIAIYVMFWQIRRQVF